MKVTLLNGKRAVLRTARGAGVGLPVSTEGGTPTTIPATVAATAERHGDRVAIRDGATCLSYAELCQAGRDFAAALVATGLAPGERVAIWSPNSVEWVVAALGIFVAGGVLVPVNTRFKGAEAADLLLRSRARVLVTVTGLPRSRLRLHARGHRGGAARPRTRSSSPAGARTGRATDWHGFLAGATPEALTEVDRRCAALGPDDPSDILFTSGTTGVPKGVVMTHGRTLRVATDWVAMTGLTAGDVYLMVNPYFHMFGLKAGILASVASGATMLPEPVFDVDRVLSPCGRRACDRVAGPSHAVPGDPRPPEP